jgi:hypothetical protein
VAATLPAVRIPNKQVKHADFPAISKGSVEGVSVHQQSPAFRDRGTSVHKRIPHLSRFGRLGPLIATFGHQPGKRRTLRVRDQLTAKTRSSNIAFQPFLNDSSLLGASHS